MTAHLFDLAVAVVATIASTGTAAILIALALVEMYGMEE